MTSLSAWYSIVYGSYIAWPGTNLFATSPELYRPMTEIVSSEAFWGLAMIAAGLSAVWLHWKDRNAARTVMSVTFLSIAVLFFMGDAERPGGPLFLLIAAFNFVQGRVAKWISASSPTG